MKSKSGSFSHDDCWSHWNITSHFLCLSSVYSCASASTSSSVWAEGCKISQQHWKGSRQANWWRQSQSQGFEQFRSLRILQDTIFLSVQMLNSLPKRWLRNIKKTQTESVHKKEKKKWTRMVKWYRAPHCETHVRTRLIQPCTKFHSQPSRWDVTV